MRAGGLVQCRGKEFLPVLCWIEGEGLGLFCSRHWSIEGGHLESLGLGFLLSQKRWTKSADGTKWLKGF
jgi:hypothetical protein